MSQYALVARNTEGSRLNNALVTHKEPLTKHGSVAPAMHTLVASALALCKEAVQIDVIRWSQGTDIDTAPVLMIARPSEHKGQIGYEIRGQEHAAATD